MLPAWAISAALLCSLWPWIPALVHLSLLAILDYLFRWYSEDSIHVFYLPGKSNLHLTFWLWIILLFVGVV